eukprot:TRINITY_DN10368_c0_g1_i4.p1 TRINITY_DN10368_c0_g1~~TRINITY_DN10368_c0_g1_i4.p1  ORF type:complete len:541 (+),score=112.08 TRINITY_DN10368_c0_g1_i4:165-1787(+)
MFRNGLVQFSVGVPSSRDASLAEGPPALLGRIQSERSLSSSKSCLVSTQAKDPDPRHELQQSRISLDTKAGQTRLGRIVASQSFDILVGSVILCNCVTMGIEVELLLGRLQSWKGLLDVTDHLFTSFFLVEVLLRVAAFGWRYYMPGMGGSWMSLGDLCIVMLTGVGAVWILPLCSNIAGSVDEGNTALQTLTVLRALRLVRLVRVISRHPAFHEVWLLLRGLSESMRTLFWTSVVIFFITYVFAIFGVVLISTKLKQSYIDAPVSGDEQQTLEDLLEMTDGIWALMFTLLQVLTLDSWTSFVREMMKYSPWCWVYFYLYVAFAVFVLMNLVTAIIVDNALKNSQKDSEAVLAEKEKEFKAALVQFQSLFEMMDVDGNGELTREEFKIAFQDPQIEMKLKMLDIQMKDCEEIFDLLDTGDGVLSLQEFFEGITSMAGLAQSKDMFKVLKRVDRLTTGPLKSPRRSPRKSPTEAAFSTDGPVLDKLQEVLAAVDALSRDVAELRAAGGHLGEEQVRAGGHPPPSDYEVSSPATSDHQVSSM